MKMNKECNTVNLSQKLTFGKTYSLIAERLQRNMSQFGWFRSQRQLGFCWVTLFAVTCASVSCATVSQSPDASKSNLDLHLESNKKLIDSIAELEQDFYSGKCEKSDRLSKEIIEKYALEFDSLNISTKLAIKACSGMQTISTEERILSAISYLDIVAKQYSPPFDSYFLHQTRSKLFAKLKDNKGAQDALLAAQKSIQKYVAESPTTQPLDTQFRTKLEPITSKIPNRLMETFKELLAIVNQPEASSRGIKILDELIPKVTNDSAKNVLRETRIQLYGAQEQRFLRELDVLSNLQKQGTSDNELKAASIEVRQKFPEPQYVLRLKNQVDDLLPPPASNVALSSINSVTNTISNSTPQQPNTKGSSKDTATVLALPSPFVATEPASNGTEKPTPDVQIDQTIISARQNLDNGLPLKAVEILDTLPAELRSERVKRLRIEAADVHIRQQRIKVRDLYNKSKSQKNVVAKIEVLNQCKEILENIQKSFPANSGKSGIERNLRLITLEINELKKGS